MIKAGESKVIPMNKDPIQSLIVDQLDWQRLDTIFNPISKKMSPLIEKYGNTGVYQVVTTENKTDDLVSKNIGYIGKSKSIFGRVYGLKINKHNACNYIRHNDLSFENVWVRFLFTEEKKELLLESLLHDKMREAYGYTFAWREASAGTDGSILRLYEMIDKISTREDAETIYSYVKERCVELYLESLGSESFKE